MTSSLERNAAALQEVIELSAHRIGRISSIVSDALVDIAHELGELVSDSVEATAGLREPEGTVEGDVVDEVVDEVKPDSEPGTDAKSTPES